MEWRDGFFVDFSSSLSFYYSNHTPTNITGVFSVFNCASTHEWTELFKVIAKSSYLAPYFECGWKVRITFKAVGNCHALFSKICSYSAMSTHEGNFAVCTVHSTWFFQFGCFLFVASCLIFLLLLFSLVFAHHLYLFILHFGISFFTADIHHNSNTQHKSYQQKTVFEIQQTRT